MTKRTELTPPLRAAVYCRISQDRSGEGLGVERQERDCRALADAEGWEVVGVYVDDNVSAFSGRARPQFDKMLSDIVAGEIDVVLAWHVDRLYRGFVDLERLTTVIKAHDITVRTVKAGDVDLSTPTGVLTAELLTSIAKHESAQKGERIKARHAQSARMGLAHGGTRPYGYERVEGHPGQLRIVEEEAAVIREAAQRVLAGESIRSIALDLQRREISTVKGRPWRPKALADILRSPRIAGVRPSNGEAVGPATWPAIVDPGMWRRLASALEAPPRGRQPRSYLLGGFLFCGRCGRRLFSSTARQGGKARRRYTCRPEEPGACASLSVEAGPVEAYVTGLLFGAAQGADLGQVRRARREGDVTALSTRLSEDEDLLTELAQDMAERRITRAEWFAARGPIEDRITETRKALAKLAPDDPIPANLADVEGNWDDLSFDQKRALIGLFVSRIYVDPARQRGGRFEPGRVRVEWKV